jgi:Fe-S cluster assembly scaffold protein SufB
MVCNVPIESPEKVGRLRDNAAILAENTEALCDNVAMRMESMARSEQMQIALLAAGSAIEKVSKNHNRLLLDTRILLQELVDNVESTFSRLNTSRSDEIEISSNMNKSVDQILTLLSTENNFDNEIAKVHDALNFENKNNEDFLF